MKIQEVPFTSINWDEIPPTTHPGETGFATWKTVEKGNIRVRIVEYSPGYLADHWCPRGHVIQILKGEMVSELKDGSKSIMKAGMTYMMSDDEVNPHRTFTEQGVTLFIVD
ncbi:MAG: DHCW motif cupin fold protein [Bacteroidetes bacterium]|nr:DHCW motif cupin fold protein [Bacteroidota bacterium]